MKVLCLATLLLVLASSVYPETCPSRQDVIPCKCTEDRWNSDIYVSCEDETINLEDVQKVLKSLHGKEKVKLLLRSVNLGKAPLDLYKGIGFKVIRILWCKLERPEVEDTLPFSGLEDTLEELDIYGTITAENALEKIYLGHLHRLKVLDMQSNTIPELSNDWFNGDSTSMKYIFLSSNQIQKLGDRAFAKLVNLEEIYFTNNELNHIQRSMFPSSAQALNSLRFSYNKLTSLPEDIFSNMPSLESISLTGNSITRLEQKTWENIWQQLEYIDLNDNPLHCDSHMHWMFDHRGPYDILGTCASPPEKKGTSLEDFILDGK